LVAAQYPKFASNINQEEMAMKANWNTVKVVFAFVIVIGTIFWAVDSVRPRTYGGTNLNADIGTGTVTLSNPSQEAVAIQLVSAGTRSFSVSSQTLGVSGTSTRQGTGRTTTQLFAFDLPPGDLEFTIARGANVNLIAITDANLTATVQPLNEAAARTTLIAAAVIILLALIYISRATDHRWISILRRQKASVPTDKPTEDSVDGGQGRALRSYGDNSTKIPS
jgi:hypothetical protein